MEHPDYLRIGDQFHKRKVWKNEEPLMFADMLDSFKETWPSLKDYCIYNLSYTSKNTRYLLGHDSYECEHGEKFEGESVKEPEPSDETVKGKLQSDEKISRNIKFRYPLVRKHPSSDALQKQKRVTIVLHGLNEFSYRKYIPWACQLLLYTDMPVVLFPLTFSINRASREWGNLKGEIRTKRQNIENAGPFNSIISERMEARPERFFWGAVQSYWDIVDFVRQIRGKKHKHIADDARIDFLGFSSGGYLALTLLLANHEGWFSESRACLFATCVEMRSLGPGSAYTIDRNTEKAMRSIYVDDVDTKCNERMKHWFKHHPEGYWLHSFGELSPDRTQRLARLRDIGPRLLAIANINDRIMSPGTMLDALQGDDRDTGVRFVYFDLGIHENPFVCPNYKPNKKYLVRPLDVKLYGSEFDNFIRAITEHLNQPL